MDAKKKLRQYVHANPLIMTVAGNIGLGKSTLTELISQDLKIPGSYELDNKVMDVDLLMEFLRASPEEKPRHCYTLEVDLCYRRLEARRKYWMSRRSFIEDRSPEEDPAVLHPHLTNLGYLKEEQYNSLQRLWKAQAGKTPMSRIMLFLHAPAEVARAGIEQRGREGELDAWQLERDLRPLQQLYEIFPQNVAQYGLHKGPILPISRVETNTLDLNDRLKIYELILELLGK